MRSTLRLLALLSLAAGLATPASAQTGEELLRKVGAFTPIPKPEFPSPVGLDYKVAWDITEGAEKPGDMTRGYAVPATFLMMTDASGIPRKNVHLAIIVHGTATRTLLQNDAYKAMTGSDNPNVAVLQALHDAGVKVIVCGQALVNRKVPRDQLLPFVEVSIAATLARATLHAQGYATLVP
jgi:intracellular sulfur oxidation DsrE/DsrF family protein